MKKTEAHEVEVEPALSLRLETGTIGSALTTPLHDTGRVRLTFLNLDGFERVEAELPAFAMRPHELDELARWICGRPNGLLKHAQNIVRHEP